MSRHMPLRTVNIPLFENAGPFEGASHLLSYIAYPDSLDEIQRQQFAAALCRFAHIKTSQFDSDWGSSLHPIRPSIFFSKPQEYDKIMKRGFSLLWRRILTAYTMLHPHVLAFNTGRPPTRIADWQPSVDNATQYLMREFGWASEDNVSTFKTKIWGPTRPVAHIGLYVGTDIIRVVRSNSAGQKELLSAIFPPAEHLSVLMKVAESIRLKLPQIRPFKFKEEETIQFLSL